MPPDSKSVDLFIVDNSAKEWTVSRYLRDWCALSRALDIATGHFEIGALLDLDGEWPKVDQIRILMGDEVTKRTKKAFADALSKINRILDTSIESEKEKNDFLEGVPAIVAALQSGKIQCRVYRKNKFHAKAYITHARQEVVGSFALVGSSNFSYPGLNDNVELNIRLSGTEVPPIQEWYEHYWNAAEDVTPDILRVIERHTIDYLPFDIYVKALQEFFRSHEMTWEEWEQTDSRMYKVLDQYQKDGYHQLLKISRQHGGAFLCDGVGLGKTYIGLMLIERLIMHDRKRVALFVPRATREDVWEPALKDLLPRVRGGSKHVFSNLAVFNHTDLGRGGDFPDTFEYVKEMADVVIIDEAHHFRNPGIKGEGERRPSRYRLLFDLLENAHGPKTLYMLTATPINNKLSDLRHMIELFSRQREDHFRQTLGINSLRGHFNEMEKELKKLVENNGQPAVELQTSFVEAEGVLDKSPIFKGLVVQRSRAYVKESQIQETGSAASFPTREAPQVAEYSVKKTYGRLLTQVDAAFKKDKPLFALTIYFPWAYYIGKELDLDMEIEFAKGRQEQVVSLIKTQFLKRFESSAYAFERSCNRLLVKLLAWIQKHVGDASDKLNLERWMERHAGIIGWVKDQQLMIFDEGEEEEGDEDIIPDELLEGIEKLDSEKFDLAKIMRDSYNDLDQLIVFLEELQKFRPSHDDKLKTLVKLLKTDPVLKSHKVLIFSEFAETARYLKTELIAAGIEGVEQIDSGRKKNRSDVIHRFSPYYNGKSTAALAAEGKSEIRVLISTDVLSEGLNLQDATRLINYDLHWNPVRLMQRIGRVDRRMNPAVEARLIADHPEVESLRGKIAYWNFLPPDELKALLTLWTRVTHKVLRISKTFGIEGKKLLHPDDDWDALKLFNEGFEGSRTPIEDLLLEYRRLLRDHPDLEARIRALPGRVFSGREHPTPGARGVFFCYRLPRPDHEAESEGDDLPWTEEAGETKWYLYDLDKSAVLEDPAEIAAVIRSAPDTPRRCQIERKTLADLRREVEKRIKNDDFKRVQAPVGVAPILKCWMELN